jgi:5-methyltetrahydrofolate--homocysteine methyltransferase
MPTLIEKLMGAGPVVTDGAWGTELQKRGLNPGENPDSWNLSHPEQVEAIARAYVAAGSKVILTNTFGANRHILEKCGLADKSHAINRAGVEISKRTAGAGAHVFASMGPMGVLIPIKAQASAEIIDGFAEQAEALCEAGADAIVVETMTDLREALAAVKGAKKTGLPVVACMVFDSGKNKDRTLMGNTVEQVVNAFGEVGADAVGANCGQGPAGFLPICQQMRALCKLPVWMKPNAGFPSIVNGVATYTMSSDSFADEVMKLGGAGANFIGGCCGTSPDYLRALSERLRNPK